MREFIHFQGITFFCRFITISFVTLGLINLSHLLVMAPLSGGLNRAILPMNNWNVYDEYSSPTVFWLTYLHHTLIILFCTFTTLANDTLVPGIMIHLCTQLEIFKSRMNNLSTLEAKRLCSLRDCIKHHLHIHK